MSQSVPFSHGDEGADRVGEQAPERRQRSDAALNRAKIIDAARRALADNDDTSMRAIAEKAGLGRGTVHRHFATREDLMDAVRRQARDDADSDEEDYLRPPGELAHVSSTPLSVADVLNKVPPFQLGEQIVAEAQRLPGVSSAADLRRRPRRREHAASRRRRDVPRSGHRPAGGRPRSSAGGRRRHPGRVRRAPPGATVAPLQLRGRAIGLLLAVGTVSDQLRDLASEAAIALALAPAYSDYIDTVRRTRPTSPAAEIQQNLLPPRIARVGGATLAGNVLPGYEIGGDWFDYTENPRGTWIGIADSAGHGAAAAGIGAVTLGAFRSVRRESTDPAESLLAMHKVLLEIGDGAASSTATIGHWNARHRRSGGSPPAKSHHFASPPTANSNRWKASCTHSWEAPTSLTNSRQTRTRLDKTERLLLLSDSFTDPTHGLGLPAITRAVAKADNNAAPATLRAIEDQLREQNPDQLDDDATIIVLAPSGMIGP